MSVSLNPQTNFTQVIKDEINKDCNKSNAKTVALATAAPAAVVTTYAGTKAAVNSKILGKLATSVRNLSKTVASNKFVKALYNNKGTKLVFNNKAAKAIGNFASKMGKGVASMTAKTATTVAKTLNPLLAKASKNMAALPAPVKVAAGAAAVGSAVVAANNIGANNANAKNATATIDVIDSTIKTIA